MPFYTQVVIWLNIFFGLDNLYLGWSGGVFINSLMAVLNFAMAAFVLWTAPGRVTK